MSAAAAPAGAPRKVLVVGIGNPDRGDDGIGAAVAERLAGRLPDDVTLLARRSDMLALIHDWEGFDALVCIDAAAPMGAPGRVHRFDLAHDELPRELAFASSHALGLAEAIELARTLSLAPAEIVVYAVEGVSFDGGAPLSAVVAEAAPDVAGRVIEEVARLRRDRPSPAKFRTAAAFA
jgi:hydrogenase maturation protease